MKTFNPLLTLIIALCPAITVCASPLTEREELTLSLNQLSQIEASLHRAQQSARTGINERYYFDYPRIHCDIITLRSRFENYLTPARVQPILRRNWNLIPGCALPGGAQAIFCDGLWLARLKRGRPESWLYRSLELKLARFGIGAQRFVLHDGVWATRRSRRCKHALSARDAHIRTLHIVLIALFLLASGMGFGWYSTPCQLMVYLPPDLRTASQHPWRKVPPATVYAFSFSVFEQINRWLTNGEADYLRNLSALRAH